MSGTPLLRTHAARQLYESISEAANTQYFMFVGRPLPFDDDQTPPAVTDTVNDTHYNVWDTMLFGKRIAPTDAAYMTRRVDWTSGNTYIPYANDVQNLQTKDFFVVAPEGVNYHIFKCLDNNSNAVSTAIPKLSETSPDDEYYQTSDGYVWKYMSSITQSQWNKFATESYVPVFENANVTSNAVSGAIDVIKINSGGAKYNAYANGTIKEAAVGGNNLFFDIESTTSILSSNTDYYKNSMLYIKSGTGAGQAKPIINYIITGSEKRVQIGTPFTTLPDITSVFEIAPALNISGDGSGALAVATVNNSSNSIHSITILDRGTGYTTADVTISSNNSGGTITDANVSVVIGPPGGHGSNVINELYARSVGFSTTFSNTENGVIPAANDFRTIGIIKDPLYANVEITLTSSLASSFIDGETLIHYTPQQSNTLLKTYSYTLSRYQNVEVGSNTDFNEGDDISFEAKSGKVLSSNSSTLNIRLGVSSDPFVSGDQIGDGTITKTIVDITAANPAVVSTANSHGLANGAAIIFAGTSTDIDDDSTPTTYYASVTGANTFAIYTDSILSTPFNNTVAGSAGYVSNGSKIDTVANTSYTFSGPSANISGEDDLGTVFGITPVASDDGIIPVIKLNGTEKTPIYSSTFFRITDSLTPNTDVIVVEVWGTQAAILESDFVGASSGEITNRAGTILRLSNVSGQFSVGQQVKGLTSGTIATIQSVDRSLSIYNQMTKVVMQSLTVGTGGGIGDIGFNFDDYVTQAETSSSGYVVDVSNSTSYKIDSIATDVYSTVTTNVVHGLVDGQSVVFSNINGNTALIEGVTYYADVQTTTTFRVYSDSGLTSSIDNRSNESANSGQISSSGIGSTGANSQRTVSLTNVTGTISESDDLSGTINTIVSDVASGGSGAEGKIISRTDPDLVDGSGEILYVDNFSPVLRAADQSEKIKLIVSF